MVFKYKRTAIIKSSLVTLNPCDVEYLSPTYTDRYIHPLMEIGNSTIPYHHVYMPHMIYLIIPVSCMLKSAN